jgi:hypothetical protein
MHFLHAAVPDRRRMRQYGCEQEGTKASSRRDADAKRDARGRYAPRRPRPRARTVRGGRATRTHISRSSRRNRSDVPRSHVTPARMPSSARCRSRTARVPRSIVSSSPALVAVAAGAVLSRDAGATGESPRQQGIRRFVGGDANLSVAEAGAATGEVGSDTGEERSTASPASPVGQALPLSPALSRCRRDRPETGGARP